MSPKATTRAVNKRRPAPAIADKAPSAPEINDDPLFDEDILDEQEDESEPLPQAADSPAENEEGPAPSDPVRLDSYPDDWTEPEVEGQFDDEPEEDQRLSRDQERRGATSIHEAYDDDGFVEQSLLTAPEPRPGFAQRWVRVMLDGRPDGRNVVRRMNQGWKPRSPSSVPGDVYVATIRHGEHKGFIGCESEVLMEIPQSRLDRKRNAIRQDNESQMEGIQAQLVGAHDSSQTAFRRPRMATKTTVSVPRNRRVAKPAED